MFQEKLQLSLEESVDSCEDLNKCIETVDTDAEEHDGDDSGLVETPLKKVIIT